MSLRVIRAAGAVGVGLIPLAWSGCNFAPKYEAPKVDAPAAYGEAAPDPGVAWNPARPGDAEPRGRWWEIYGDPQLNSLEEQVAVSNQGIAAAEASLRAARAAAAAARSAYFPTVAVAPAIDRVRGSQTWNQVSGAGTTAASGAGGAASSVSPATIVNQYTLPFEASYELDLWGRVRNQAAAGAYSAQASAADLATALLATQAELAQDYFQARALDAEKAILDDTVASYRRALELTSTLFRSGIDSEEDVARAQNQLDAAVAQATDTGVSRAAVQHAIAVLIGRAPAGFSLPAGGLPERPPAVPAGLPSELVQRRPDVAAAERRVAAANAQIGVARSAYFPSLSLGAEAGWESTRFSRWFTWPSRFWSVGPEVAGVLFDGGARKAQTEQARAAYDMAAADYRRSVLEAFQSVEDNLAALRILGREEAEQQTAVRSSRRLLELATTRFQTGIDGYLNVVTAQAALLSSREAEVQVRLRQMAASVSLVQALGGGWSAERH